ncbi:DEAD/DEAH box helicase [Aequorivita xiaoshiensis]|uniref:DEAD-box ATP-dependent RNA helicase RhpA n=1 Tax=Aequorivita xiaoshiensis TaxID=2874476 RepID=A0A9X1R3D6_9FLAO|nr:DEAD/DEAH box helicase [Aequorivita xiaoshiensis]MCG2431192.1 DEAD/DEAH box helicase [Aequorivita xiaoshiensis]
MTFKSLGLSDALLKAISKKGYETPSAIQQKAIPLILERKDVLASAQTGSGKTAGFALPLLQILQNQPILHKRPVRALILTPTRELAAQVQQEFKDYSEFTALRSTVIFGGVGANPQINALRNGVDVLVATPGRLLDLHSQRAVSLSKVEILGLDEADRMLDMGFARDIKKILALLPSKRQNLLFSATFSKEIKKLANEFLHQPVLVEATPENTTVEKIDQTVYRVDKNLKTDLIIKLISEGNWQQVLVFTRTKHGANRLSEKLAKAKITSAAIHGNKSQGARTRALAGFKEGRVRVLVATDIAARGLDIPLLPHVINYELPNVSEDYVHRIGRTGRAGASGEALSLVSLDEVGYLKDIEKLIGERLQAKTLPDFEPTETMADVKKAQAEKKRQKAAHHSRGRNASRGKGSSKGKSTRSSKRR